MVVGVPVGDADNEGLTQRAGRQASGRRRGEVELQLPAQGGVAYAHHAEQLSDLRRKRQRIADLGRRLLKSAHGSARAAMAPTVRVRPRAHPRAQRARSSVATC